MPKIKVTKSELQAWYLLYKFDHSLDVTPEKISYWLETLESRRERYRIHKKLYQECDEYRNKFEEVYRE